MISNFLQGARAVAPLFRNLVRRDVRQRYKGSVLGVAWTLVTPIVTVAAYWVVFRFLFGSPIPHYALFLFVGLMVWSFFYAGLQAASLSITGNAALVTKNSFPREIIPLSSITANGVTVAAMLAIAAPLCIVVSQESPAPMLALPLIGVCLAALTAGLGLLLAGLNVYFRDTSHILAALGLPWFFLTPIFYSYATLPALGGHQDAIIFVLHYVNFASPFVIATQDALFFGQWPAATDLIYCVAASAIALSAGVIAFRRMAKEMAVEL